MENKVLLCTSVGPGKEYSLGFLLTVIGRIQGVAGRVVVWDSPDDPGARFEGSGVTLLRLPVGQEETGPYARYRRLARVREAAREQFLAGDWSHIYWHDSDMIPPASIVASLLGLTCAQCGHAAHDAAHEGEDLARSSTRDVATSDCVQSLRESNEVAARSSTRQDNEAVVRSCSLSIASGLYNMRDTTLPQPPMMGAYREISSAAPFTVRGFGMGCMLTSRAVLERVEFDSRNTIGEDYQFCLDAAASGFLTWIDPTLRVWHVGDNGLAVQLSAGAGRRGAIWEDAPWKVTSLHCGEFERNVPRYDLTEAQLAMLGPGYYVGEIPDLSVAVRPVSEVLNG